MPEQAFLKCAEKPNQSASAARNAQSFLADLLPMHAPPLVPRDRDQIVNAAPKAIEHAVLRNARHSRAVIDRNLLGRMSAAMHQHRQESVQAVKTKKTIQCRAFENTKRATRIGKINAQGRTPRPTRNFRRHLPHPCVFALGTDAANKIRTAFYFGN